MARKYLFIFLAFFCQLVLAETCPSVADIKNNKVNDWKAFDSDDGIPLSVNRAAAFKKHAQEFALAEWVKNGSNKSFIRCYYRDNAGSDLEAYLAKESFTPKKTKSYWYEVSGSMQCAAGMQDCEFEKEILMKTQLAKK